MRVKLLFLILAVALAVKAAILGGIPSLCLAGIFLASYHLVHFFGIDTASAKLNARISALELESNQKVSTLGIELAEVKRLQAQSNMAQGIRPAYGTKS